jgi:hypothetical protein
MNKSPIKDSETEQPIPLEWRPAIVSIVSALVIGDYNLRSAGGFVRRLSDQEATQLRQSVDGYGNVVIVELPPETWETSVAIWMGSRWEALIDLYTVEEGQSDLVLMTNVYESGDSYEFEIYGLMVP